MVRLTLIQGDCRNALKKIPENSIDCIILDPPYNLKSSSDFDYPIVLPEEYIEDIDRVAKENCTVWFFCMFYDCDLISVFKKYFNLVDMIIWYKPNKYNIIPNRYPNDVELCFRFTRGNPTFNREKRTLKQIKEYPLKFKFTREIPFKITPKPLELIEELISVSTNEGDWVLDPFLGSGTTMEACLRLKRNCYGIEINPKCIPIIKKRLNWNSNLGDVEFEFLNMG